MNRRITEQNQDSLSLNQNTVIQQYNNLDYSDEYQSEHSSQQEHSLSRYNQQEMEKMDEISKIYKKQTHQQKKNHNQQRKNNERLSLKYGRDLQSKYDFGVSPSTKQEYSLLNPPPRLSNPYKEFSMHSKQNYDNFDMHELDEQSQERQFDLSQRNRQPQQRRRQEKYIKKQASKTNNKHFDIDNFLNAHPVPLKNKKGLNILTESNQYKLKEKYKVQEHKMIRQEQSIVLVTLPQNVIQQNERQHHNKANLVKAIKQNEQQFQKITRNYQRRFKDTRLNFIDTFMPQSMKIKKNPYNLLKYIHNKTYV